MVPGFIFYFFIFFVSVVRERREEGRFLGHYHVGISPYCCGLLNSQSHWTVGAFIS